jgi:hypothetical protein
LGRAHPAETALILPVNRLPHGQASHLRRFCTRVT